MRLSVGRTRSGVSGTTTFEEIWRTLAPGVIFSPSARTTVSFPLDTVALPRYVVISVFSPFSTSTETRDSRVRRARVAVDGPRTHLDLASARLRRRGPAHLEERARADRVERSVGEHDLRRPRAPGLDEVAFEEALALQGRAEGRAARRLDRDVAFHRNQRCVSRLVFRRAAERPARVGLRLDSQPEGGIVVLARVRILGPLQEVARLRQVRAGPHRPAGRSRAVDELRGGLDLLLRSLLGGSPRLDRVEQERGRGEQDEDDSPPLKCPNRDDEPIDVRADGLAEYPLALTLKHPDLRDLSSLFIAHPQGVG